MACLILVHLAHSILFVFALCLTWHPLPHHNLSIVRRRRSAEVIHTYSRYRKLFNCRRVCVLCSALLCHCLCTYFQSHLFFSKMNCNFIHWKTHKVIFLILRGHSVACGACFLGVRALHSELRRALFLLFDFQLSQDPHFPERIVFNVVNLRETASRDPLIYNEFDLSPFRTLHQTYFLL